MAITNYTSQCLNGQPRIVHGDGNQTHDFTYIDDVVKSILELLDTDVADGETMNIVSTDTITVEELAEHVIDETGADVDIVFESAREADARQTHAEIAKARNLIGYEPSVDIKRGVSAFVEWYRENRGKYEPLIRAS